MRRAKTDVRATIDAAKSQKRREVEEHEHRLAAEAQEQALATRIGDLYEDFLADAGAGMIPNVFDRVAIGFAALQDAFVEETKHFAHEAAEAAHLRAQAGLDRARFQNATLRVQLEQNRIAAQQVQEQMKLQLRIATPSSAVYAPWGLEPRSRRVGRPVVGPAAGSAPRSSSCTHAHAAGGEARGR